MLSLTAKADESILMGEHPVASVTVVWIEKGEIGLKITDHKDTVLLELGHTFNIRHPEGPIGIQFVSQKRNYQVRLGFNADRSIRILRGELVERGAT